MSMIISSCLLVNFVLPEPNPDAPEDKVAFGLKYKLPNLAVTGYQELLEKEPTNPDHYFGLIQQERLADGNLKGLALKFARAAMESHETEISNVLHLAAGLSEAALENHFQAIFHYNKVSEVELKYLNYGLGTSYMALRRYGRAKVYLSHEQKLPQGYHLGSSRKLFLLLGLQEAKQERQALIENAETRSLLHPEDVRVLAFNEGKPWIYLLAVFNMLQEHFNLTGFLAALGVMMIWLVFLRKLDVFNPEKWGYIFGILILGMLMSLGVFILADTRQLVLNMADVTHGDSFLYWVLDVGMVEELVKIIPLLGLIWLTQVIDEPFDYILYASVSALGFAFIENGLYYDGVQLNIIHARAMTAVVGHMFHSSIIAYGIILCKYRFPKIPIWLGFSLAFLVASFSHGLYDYLLGKGIYMEVMDKNIYPAFVIFFLLIILFWSNFINNSLNQSPYFDERHSLRPIKLMQYLVIALTAVLAFEYLTIGLHYGSEIANRSLLQASVNGSFMILVLAFGLSRIELAPGEWKNMRWQAILPYNRTKEGRIQRASDRQNILGTDLFISAYTYNVKLKNYFPQISQAKVLESYSLISPENPEKREDWYLVELTESIPWELGLGDQVLIKFRSQDEFKRQGKSLALLMAIPNREMLASEELKREAFLFLGWVKVRRESPNLPSQNS